MAAGMADCRLEIGSYAGYKGEDPPRFFSHAEKITVLNFLLV